MEAQFIKYFTQEAREYLKSKGLDESPENITAFMLQYGYIGKHIVIRKVIFTRFFEVFRVNGCMKKKTVECLSDETGLSERHIYSIFERHPRGFERRADINII